MKKCLRCGAGPEWIADVGPPATGRPKVNVTCTGCGYTSVRRAGKLLHRPCEKCGGSQFNVLHRFLPKAREPRIPKRVQSAIDTMRAFEPPEGD